MGSGQKIVLGITAFVALCWVAVLTAGAYAYHRYGVVHIDVSEGNGGDISVQVPGAFVHWGLAAIETVDWRGTVHPLARPFVATREREAARVLLEELAIAPDGVYIEILGDRRHHGDPEKATVAKKNGLLEIRVEDGDGTVRIQVPAALAERALQFAVGRAAI